MGTTNRIAELIEEKSARDGRTWTQEEIAALTGISYSAINRYINNKVTRFDADTLEKFARWLDCNVGDLFTKRKDKTSSESNAPTLAGARAGVAL